MIFIQVDDELNMFKEQKSYKKRNTLMAVIVFTVMTLMIILDVISRWRTVTMLRDSLQQDDQRNAQIRVEISMN